jgi:glycine cleavage system H protein
VSNIPDDLTYTPEHEWVRAADGSVTARIGITDHAQEALGDVVYVSLPELGAPVTAGGAFGEIESTKSVSDLFAPVSGSVSARNEALEQEPGLINSDPYGEGWIVEIEMSNPAELDGLLDAAAYGSLAE